MYMATLKLEASEESIQLSRPEKGVGWAGMTSKGGKAAVGQMDYGLAFPV